jgi:hypothetical protein
MRTPSQGGLHLQLLYGCRMYATYVQLCNYPEWSRLHENRQARKLLSSATGCRAEFPAGAGSAFRCNLNSEHVTCVTRGIPLKPLTGLHCPLRVLHWPYESLTFSVLFVRLRLNFALAMPRSTLHCQSLVSVFPLGHCHKIFVPYL